MEIDRKEACKKILELASPKKEFLKKLVLFGNIAFNFHRTADKSQMAKDLMPVSLAPI